MQGFSLSSCKLKGKQLAQIYQLVLQKTLPRKPTSLVPAGEALILHLAGELLNNRILSRLDSITLLSMLKDQLLSAAEDLQESSITSEVASYQLSCVDGRYVSFTHMASLLDLQTCTMVDEMPAIPLLVTSINLTKVFMRLANPSRVAA